MCKKGSLKKFNIIMLKIVCEYFGVCIDGFYVRCKVEYIFVLVELIDVCGCCFVWDLYFWFKLKVFVF